MTGNSNNTTKGGSPHKFQPHSKPQTSAPSSGLQPQCKPPSIYYRLKHAKGSTCGRPPIVCFHCHKPGHVMSNCHRRLAKMSEKPSEGASVQLLSTIFGAPVVDSHAEPVVKQKEHLLDPRFEQHCSSAQLVRPDTSVK